jgi:hypothetical protein
MSHQQLHRFTTRFLCVSAILVGLGPASAALPVPCKSEHRTPEAQLAAMHRHAEESLRQKIAVGQERHEQRLQFRQTLVSSRQSQTAAREQQILAQISPAPAAPLKRQDQPSRLLAGLGVLTCVALLGLYALQSRPASEPD